METYIGNYSQSSPKNETEATRNLQLSYTDSTLHCPTDTLTVGQIRNYQVAKYEVAMITGPAVCFNNIFFNFIYYVQSRIPLSCRAVN